MTQKTMLLATANLALLVVTIALSVTVYKDVVMKPVTQPNPIDEDQKVSIPTQPSPVPLVGLYASFKITPENVTLRKGQKQTFDVSLSTIEESNSIGAADIVLTYEPLDLEVDLQSLTISGSQFQLIQASPGEQPGELIVSIGTKLGEDPSKNQQPLGFSISTTALRSTENYPTMFSIDTKSTVASKNGAMVTAPSAATVTIQD